MGIDQGSPANVAKHSHDADTDEAGGQDLDVGNKLGLPQFSSDGDAPDDTVFFHTDDNQYKYKDSGGSVRNANALVDSVFGRTGEVTAQSGDYGHSQLSGVETDDHHAKYTDQEAADAAPIQDSSDIDHDQTQGGGDSDAHHIKTQPSDIDSTNWDDYEIQKNGTDGSGIINFKT